MWSLILSAIGSWLPSLGQTAVAAYKARLDASNTTEHINADLAARELAVEQREQELRAQIIVAEQGNWMTRWVRPVWAAPFIIWTWKVVIWDICLGWGSTPELKGVSAQLILVISGAYFFGRSAETVARIIKK